jgi:uncharacterized membrane protein
MDQRNQTEKQTNNVVVVSAIAYLTLVGWFIAIFFLNKPKDPLADFHIRQALGINLLLLACGIVFIIPVLGWVVGAFGYFLALVLWILGIISAIRGEEKEVPLLGEKFQEWFQGL